MELKIFNNCLIASQLVSKKQHQSLNFKDYLRLNMHLMFCKCCKNLQADLEYVKVKLAEIDNEEIYLMNENYKKELTQKVLEGLEK